MVIKYLIIDLLTEAVLSTSGGHLGHDHKGNLYANSPKTRFPIGPNGKKCLIIGQQKRDAKVS